MPTLGMLRQECLKVRASYNYEDPVSKNIKKKKEYLGAGERG